MSSKTKLAESRQLSYGGKEKRSRWGIGLYLGVTHNYDEGLPDGSGMSREAHVPFYEGLAGKFRRSTHQ